MNCPKCNAVLRPGVKFCTSCGQKIEQSTTCTQCGSPLKQGAKFCIKCGQRVILAEKTSAPSQETPSDINSVKGRIYWNIQPGQVARVITRRNSTLIIIFKESLSRKEQQLTSVPTVTRLPPSAGVRTISRVPHPLRPEIHYEKVGNLSSTCSKKAKKKRNQQPKNSTGSNKI